ncbi:13146_t:CDS:1, partial [Rhizophagus irregularis]
SGTSEKECREIIAKVNRLLKHSCKLPISCPNVIIFDKDILNAKNLYALQLESLSKNTMYHSNGDIELKNLFKINLYK